jgi:hypothetical protein
MVGQDGMQLNKLIEEFHMMNCIVLYCPLLGGDDYVNCVKHPDTLFLFYVSSCVYDIKYFLPSRNNI